MSGAVIVVEPGVATTLQDMGRPGYAHLGVPGAGAVDRPLAALVNRLVGNPPDAAVIETCGNLVLGATQPLLIATTHEVAPRFIRADEQVRIAGGEGRLWHYVAVRGGIAAVPVLGSRSTDTLSGLGPRPLRADERLAVGDDPPDPITVDHASIAPLGNVARITLGPRADWFTADVLALLGGAVWTVTASNRIGVRLAGSTLARLVTDELPSEGLVRGAIQVPPDGSPVMMLADHPTTGGYPVIAVVHPDDIAIVAQTSAGHRVRFRL